MGALVSVPTEAEIRDAAMRLGLADEHGNYPRSKRSVLAAAVQRAKADEDSDADPMSGSTAAVLARFADDLAVEGPFTPETVAALLTEAARHLLRTEGLQINPRKETTP